MIKSTVSKRVVSSLYLARLIIFSILVLTAPQLVLAQPAPAGWIDQQAAMVSPEAAQATITQREQILAQQRSLQAQQQSSQMATAGKTTLAAQQASTIQSAAASGKRIYSGSG
jgi:ABC-type microcin C transport system permease subunit YejB